MSVGGEFLMANDLHQHLENHGKKSVLVKSEGVFLVKMKNVFVPIEHVYSMNTYLCIQLSHEGVSERSREQSEQAK